MTDARWRLAGSPGVYFSEVLLTLSAYRGLEAERELEEFLGSTRYSELLNGEEPRFGEFLEIARILRVPLSTFQISSAGQFPELELAYAELLYHAASMTPVQRHELAGAMVSLVRPEASDAEESSAEIIPLPRRTRED